MPGAVQDNYDPPQTRAPYFEPQAVNLKPDSSEQFGQSPSRF